MKIKLTILTLLGLSTLAFIYHPTSIKETKIGAENKTVLMSPPSTNGGLDKFYVGAINDNSDYHCYGCTGNEHFTQLNQLGFNLWHQYVTWESGPVTGFLYPGSPFAFAGDNLFADVEDYAPYINPRITQAYDYPSNRRLIMTRPKIEYLCYGQRSDYQCESVSTNDGLWFYAFNESDPLKDIDDNSPYGQGARVKYMQVNANQTDGGASWVVKRLKANTEQCKPGPWWQGDAQSEWFIKPKIRIAQSFANTQANWDKLVCRIDVYDQDGYNSQDPEQNKIKSIDIRVRNFKPGFSTQYNGNYKEEFTFIDPEQGFWNDTSSQSRPGAWGDSWTWNARGTCASDPSWDNHADIQVYWYGNCDMWIDYVRVDNDIAHDLLSNDPFNPNWVQYNTWLQEEVTMIGNQPLSGPYPILKYYIELFEFNNIPCMKYVNEKLQQYSNHNADLLADLTPDNISFHVPVENIPEIWNAEFLNTYYIQKVNPSCLYSQSYPLNAGYGITPSSQTISKIPATMPLTTDDSILAKVVSVSEYEQWLQDNLDHTPSVWEGGMETDKICGGIQQWIGDYRSSLQMCDELSKLSGKPFIFMPQAHQWYNARETHREPTNEELDMMTNVAVSYGARSLNYFSYPSGSYTDLPIRNYSYSSNDYGIGIADVAETYPSNKYTLRHTNVYDQNDANSRDKWKVFRDISDRMVNKWGPYLMSFDNAHRHSYIYNLDNEREACRMNEYFSSIASYYRGNAYNNCVQDDPGFPPYDGLIYDCAEETYLQAATFEKEQDDGNNYFMIVNRRCSPLQPATHNDGERFIRVHFDSDHAELNGSNNWVVTDLVSGWNTVFDKTNSAHVLNLGWFNPGEGRLYKMTPLPKSGGVLAGDEFITGESFTCEDTIFSNGYNITIGAGTNIKFTDSSCIVMNGGVFTMGDQQVSGPQNISFDAPSGSAWRGHSFTGTEVHIYGATFSGLANDSVYALNMVDCPVVDIRGTTFNTAGTLKGAVNAVYYANDDGRTVNFYIGGNTFTATGSTIPTINVSSFAGMTTPLIIENNTFTNGNTAIFLTGITGGAIKNNNISENYTGISLLSSYIDVSGNAISSTVNGSTGIFAAGGSEVKMNPAGPKKFGGMNNISNEGTGTNNIKVEGSYFLTDGGQNVFNISDIQTSYHLYGYFPMYMAIPYDERVNCFKVSGSPVVPPYNYVTDGYQGNQLSFSFSPYLTGCDPEGGDSWIVLDMGNGIYDTVYTDGSGSGGSVSSIRNYEFGINNKKQKQIFVQTIGSTYDSICLLMRSRNYTSARTKCLEMINSYPDSIHSLNAISKLYLASVSSNANITELKTFFENLILNHSNNTSLVKRANYYILKCKVRLHEYTSALAGFQQIINENPYSYEGLIAKWDYMATSLLVPGAGSFGSEPTVSVLDENSSVSIDIVNALQREAEDDDKSPFTKEQRIYIRKSINTAIESDKNDNDRKVRVLETKSAQGDLNAIKELAQEKALKQVVKTEKPRNITDHIKLVSEDIRKVFGSVTGGKGKGNGNIPMVYRLSQNYPNPFNPVTNIKYQIPNNKTVVKISVYDILGREVITLVNSVQDAGEYVVDFNAANYASGVYFYRIEAEESNGNKFVDSKKMVLLK